ncbi:MAG: DUF2066 domain-containing protein [Pseudomonadales bacterium]
MQFVLKSSRSLLIFLLFVAQPINAVVVEDLYLATVITKGQSDAQRRKDAAEGLLQVLVRVSGRADIESNPIIAGALRKPESYYSEFSYVDQLEDSSNSEQDASGIELIASEEPQRPSQVMRIRFEPSLVSKLLRAAELPVWGSNRPAVLSWMAIREVDSRVVIGAETPVPFAEDVIKAASQRGVPLLLPLWDLEDTQMISSSEIWGRFMDRIESASERYSPDKILVFRAEAPYLNEWQGEWSLGEAGRWRGGTVYGSDQSELAQALVNAIAIALSDQYGVGSMRSEVMLTVEGITNAERYAAVSKYLEGLTQIVSVQPVRVYSDIVAFKLRSEGEVQQIVDVIELDRQLSLLRQDEGTAMLWYRWIP